MPFRRLATLALASAAAGGAIALFRASRAPCGSVRRNLARSSMPDVRAYEIASRWFLGPVHEAIARSIASEAPAGATILEVGCGPGHLGIRVARRAGRHGPANAAEGPAIGLTCSDLDPAMISRAIEHADRAFGSGDARRPAFIVADVADLPFPDRSFDMVVTTFSLHHWSDVPAGIAEIHRVLRPGGRARIWDIAGLPRRLEVGTGRPESGVLAGPFGSAAVGERWALGPLTLVERYDLQRPADTP